MFLHAVEIERRKKFPVGHCIDAVLVSADPHEFLMRVPRGHFAVANGPFRSVAISMGRLELIVTPSLAGPPPGKGPSAHLIAPDPIEKFFLHIGMIGILDKKWSVSSPNPAALV